MQEFSAFANRLADEAGEIIRGYFRRPFEVETKSDQSPVTIADKAVEARLREIIEKERPEDGIYGEEYGVKKSQNGLTWVLDPIDGTKSFVIGRATFGTLIALCDEDEPKLGIIDQPIMKERWLGLKGIETTYTNQHLGDEFINRPMKTASCTSLDVARIGSTTPAMFGDNPIYKKFNENRFFWGGDCYQYGLMACGFVDVILEANMSPYDYLALVPIIEGAGGHISDFEGKPLNLNSDDTVVACGDRSLLPAVQALINS